MTGNSAFDRVEAAAATVRAKLGAGRARVGVVLGSGLGGFASRLADARSIPYGEIPGFAKARVAGHAARLHRGHIDGVEVFALAGRIHLYEGHPLADVVLPVRVLCRLGVDALVVTNAAGGIAGGLKPGDIMLIDDHLNLTGHNPLIGEHDDRMGERFVDMTEAYNAKLREAMVQAAGTARVELKRGVYAGLLGPTYETPAEVRMLDALGASAVGMSTVNEVIAARGMKTSCVGLSLITNLGAGRGGAPLSHAEVEETAHQAAERFETLVVEFVRKVP